MSGSMDLDHFQWCIKFCISVCACLFEQRAYDCGRFIYSGTRDLPRLRPFWFVTLCWFSVFTLNKDSINEFGMELETVPL